ncbi:hypothetical protein PEDI_44550 [Persicobacter diffluens]|uniref:Uncharacterized protein n=1 Tax=Persicobacter diffluens TaxID=981 RepID=A0AAN4W3D6_9BACT|nr:hypothetical protein PEDI_44550 [Persicobacter diffluens]
MKHMNERKAFYLKFGYYKFKVAPSIELVISVLVRGDKFSGV